MALAMIKFSYLIPLYVVSALAKAPLYLDENPDSFLHKRELPIIGSLVNFQVHEPVLSLDESFDETSCVYTETLMVHEFANSYGVPFIGQHTPPPCSFNRVTINFTATSKGRQFDRLGLMYLGDVEVWRTSTAEPTANGIVWSYEKELDQYNALWTQSQKIIFDLGNVVDDTYTGPYFTTLTATFFTVPQSAPTADIILPISAKQSGSDLGSAFTVPSQKAWVSYELPRNIERAAVSLSACGQIAEEFWYTNVFSSDVNTFEPTAGTLSGYGPWREVQLLIDEQLTGVSWPFPIVFTGGIVPGFWRPIVGIDAFDLRQHELDITPWLPLLCDGASHTFEIRVVGLDDDGNGTALVSETVGSYWVVTGTIFLFLGDEGSVTTGSKPSLDALTSGFLYDSTVTTMISSDITANSTGANQTLTYTTAVNRNISVTSTIKSSQGERPATWTQTLAYKNFNALTDEGFVQFTEQNTTGSDRSAYGYANTYSYPLTVNSSFFVDSEGQVGINATLNRGLDFDVHGPPVFPSGIQKFNGTSPTGDSRQEHIELPSNLPFFGGSLLSTTQSGSAKYFSGINKSYSFGTTEQNFDFKGVQLGSSDTYELYHRHVLAVNSTVTEDEENLAGETLGAPVATVRDAVVQPDFGSFSVRAVLGRGPGRPKTGG